MRLLPLLPLRSLISRLSLVATLALAACLKNQPLISAENAYDPRLALTDDSLSTFDRLEVVLVDELDTGRVIRIWKGHPDSLGALETEFTGDTRTLMFLVRGYRLDQLCLTEIIAQDGRVRHKALLCPSAVKVTPTMSPRVLGFSGSDSMLPLRVAGGWGNSGKMIHLKGPPWLQVQPDRFQGDADLMVSVRLLRDSLAKGAQAGSIDLFLEDVLMNSVAVTVDTSGRSVPLDSPSVKPPSRILRGKVTDWDSLPVGGMSVMLDGGPNLRLTDAAGNFDFGPTDIGSHVLSVSGSFRMGARDTVMMASQDTLTVPLRISPVIGVTPVVLTWSRNPGPVSIASGRGLIASMGFDQPGLLAAFPLANTAQSLQRFHELGNGDGGVIPTYSEPGDLVADSETVFVAYPEDSRLGRIGNWRSQPVTLSMKIGMQPGALLLDGEGLLVLGRLGNGTLALGEYARKDLSLTRMDTLKGFHWDGVVPLQRTPRLVALGNAYFAIEGNGPAEPGRLIRIDKSTRRVTGSVEMEEASPADLAVHQDNLYLVFPASAQKVIRVYDKDLRPAGTLPAEHAARRIAFPEKGRFAGCGFLLGDAGLKIFASGAIEPAADLTLPGFSGPGHLAVDHETGQAIVCDGNRLFLIGP